MVQKRKRKKKAPVDEINADAKKESLVKKKSAALQKVPAEREHPLKVNEENDLETEEGASCSGDHVEEDMEVEDDFHDLINSEDEEVIGENGESSKGKDDAPKNDDSGRKKSEARARTDVENPEDPGDAYRRILNVKIQETLNLIDQYDVSFKMQLYQEIRSIVSSLFEDANLEFGNVFEALDIFEAEAKADMMEEADVDEKQEKTRFCTIAI